MTVHTSSGSKYVFTMSKGKLWVLYGTKEIMVTDIENLEVGKRMTVKGYALNIYCQPDHNKFMFQTSIIVNID